MADQVKSSADAIHLKLFDKIELGASQQAVDTAERFWNHTLDWGAAHPFYVAGLALLIAWTTYQRRLGRREIASMKNEMENRRVEARMKEPPLPLPPPDPKA